MNTQRLIGVWAKTPRRLRKKIACWALLRQARRDGIERAQLLRIDSYLDSCLGLREPRYAQPLQKPKQSENWALEQIMRLSPEARAYRTRALRRAYGR